MNADNATADNPTPTKVYNVTAKPYTSVRQEGSFWPKSDGKHA